VDGDEEEDGVDDIDGEFGLHGRGDADDAQHVAESMLRAQMSYGRGGADARPFDAVPNVPLLTNGQMVDDIPPEQHALVPSYMAGGGGGKRIHPLPFADPSLPGAW
jgi:cellulose synthase A